MEFESTTREEWNFYRNIMRKSGRWESWLRECARKQRAKKDSDTRKWIADDQINWRAELWDDITRNARDGKVGVVVSGMDCDCSQYYREFVMDLPKGAFLHQLAVEKHEQYLDGPESTSYVDPDRIEPQSHSRDLALEAFEDGHAHVVYA